MGKELERLRALTKMALGVEMMKLQQAVLAEKQKTAQIDALKNLRKTRAESLSEKGGADLALYGGADQRWAQWSQVKVSELNTQKAAMIVQKEEQKMRTQTAFGKDEAVRRLVESEQEEERIVNSRY